MGSKKHKRDSSTSSSSDSSHSSNDSKELKRKRSKRQTSEESESNKKIQSNDKDSDRGGKSSRLQSKNKRAKERSAEPEKSRGNKSGDRSKSRERSREPRRSRDRSRGNRSRDRSKEDDRNQNKSRADRSREGDARNRNSLVSRGYDMDTRKRDSREHYNPRDRHGSHDNSYNSYNKRHDRPYQRNTRRDNRRRSRSKSFDHTNAKWGRNDDNAANSNKKEEDKQKPNFALSGKLTEERNTYKGVVIKYSEPPEARKPKRRWRLYPFKGDKALQTLYIHRESAYLIGRERKVVDLPVDHPSCSKQHAALQYRLVPFTREDGSVGKRVRPYLIDLDSANGTFINNKKIDPKKYVELLERDVIKFGFSSREYVLLHENSKDEALDDDVKMEDEEGELKEEKLVKVEKLEPLQPIQPLAPF